MNEGLSAWVEVLPDFKNFRSKSESEMTTILGDAGDKAGKRGSSAFGGAFVGGIGKLAGVVIGAIAALGIANAIGSAIGEGINYGLNSIEIASNLAETRSAIDTLFGDASAGIQDFASTAVNELGQTQQEALAAAQTFGIFGKAAGLGGEDLTQFSTSLVGLSADLASFFNTDSQTAIDAIGAGLRGESEPLRQFGVLLDDATLKQKALELGIYNGSGALTQQQRVLAAQAAIFDQTAIAQGDVERTSGGLAFQQKKLQAALEDTQAKLGEKLLPAFTSFVTLANDKLIPVLSETIDKVGPVLAEALVESLPAFSDLVDQIAPLIPELVRLSVEVLPALIQAFIVLAPFVTDAAANVATLFGIFNLLFSFLAGDTSLSEAQGEFDSLGGSVLSNAYNVAQGLQGMLIGFSNWVATIVNPVITAVNKLGDAAEDFINSFSKITGVSVKINDLAKLGTVSLNGNGSKSALGSGAGTGGTAFAEGGVVGARPGGINAVIGEGRYDEAVIPLNAQVLGRIGEGMAAASGGRVGGPQVVQYITTSDPLLAADIAAQKLNKRMGGLK